MTGDRKDIETYLDRLAEEEAARHRLEEAGGKMHVFNWNLTADEIRQLAAGVPPEQIVAARRKNLIVPLKEPPYST